MEQKELEARLVALEAEFAEKRHGVDNLIRSVQNDISFDETTFNNALRKHKETLRRLESEKQFLNVSYQKGRAELYKEFASEGNEGVDSAN